MTTQLVVDTNSILYFIKYYWFDKNIDNIIYPKLTQFLLSKVKSDEIIILDKVFNEVNPTKYTKNFKTEIEQYAKPTLFLFNDVEKLSSKYYIMTNEKFYNNDQNQIELELNNYGEKYADLYLIAYCNYLKKDGNHPILITEETGNEDKNQKLIKKIPTICREEKIEYRSLPYSLFEFYKDQLKFDLEIA